MFSGSLVWSLIGFLNASWTAAGDGSSALSDPRWYSCFTILDQIKLFSELLEQPDDKELQ